MLKVRVGVDSGETVRYLKIDPLTGKLHLASEMQFRCDQNGISISAKCSVTLPPRNVPLSELL